MAELVYVLCAVTCLLCALLLGRAYGRSRQRLLLWSTLCFAGLFLNNVVTIVDLLLIPQLDMRWLRDVVACASIGALLIGLLEDRS